MKTIGRSVTDEEVQFLKQRNQYIWSYLFKSANYAEIDEKVGEPADDDRDLLKYIKPLQMNANFVTTRFKAEFGTNTT